jgi:hypothetical protein
VKRIEELQANAEEQSRLTHGSAGSGRFIHRKQGLWGIEVLVERSSHEFKSTIAVTRGGRTPQIQSLNGSFQVATRPIPVGSVVVIKECHPHRCRLTVGDEIFDKDQIAEGFRHLCALKTNESNVEPVSNKGLMGYRFRLRSLAFVVREHEITAATMHI